MKLKTLANLFDEFLFKAQPVYSVALLRIGMGCLLLLNWAMIYCDLDSLYGPDGIISLATAQNYGNQLRFSLFDYLPNTANTTLALAVIHLLAVLALTFGFWTKRSIFIAFVTLVSFHHRNGFIINSADSVLRIFLFFLLFTPCADAFSVDRWILRLRGLAPEVPLEKAPWALRLIQLQFCTIYIATVLFKLKGERWMDGTAVYVATRLDDFVRYELPLLNSMYFVKFLTWSTLLVELSMGTLVWIKEFRYWVLLGGVALHLGIEYTMSIPVFEWAMIVMMICMIDSRDLEAIIQKLKHKRDMALSSAHVTTT
ncbi:HTTM domain-containing protein [Bdellovibrio svalbardensis]|uniref:HTTM domain-containing protein n=1 Tax=Bdellovibrio svalbardensis TaxID=2972972 RepID=A0ABT6DJA7_9BACT|nr:HTTM domain-containing protein [Bdellovibrio svalbardensis]MDG0816927.1 HTTM domain-containing protein [Bdellovibrio svalbardensis]